MHIVQMLPENRAKSVQTYLPHLSPFANAVARALSGLCPVTESKEDITKYVSWLESTTARIAHQQSLNSLTLQRVCNGTPTVPVW
jgi:hypothetical protein